MLAILISKIIRIYQMLISPFLGQNCRYYPTCSCYAQECFEKLPIHLAIWYSVLRILKCNQFFPGGYDPVPEKNAVCKLHGKT